MKAAIFVLILAICNIECRKVVQINKNANIDFINMEIGGGVRPTAPVRQPSPVPVPSKPQSSEPPKNGPAQQPLPVPAATTSKPVPAPVPTKPLPAPVTPVQPKPAQSPPNQMDLKPVPAKPTAAGGVTTPGYGNVKQLVTFYDSQGKASAIRPYSYSQAVKQG